MSTKTDFVITDDMRKMIAQIFVLIDRYDDREMPCEAIVGMLLGTAVGFAKGKSNVTDAQLRSLFEGILTSGLS